MMLTRYLHFLTALVWHPPPFRSLFSHCTTLRPRQSSGTGALRSPCWDRTIVSHRSLSAILLISTILPSDSWFRLVSPPLSNCWSCRSNHQPMDLCALRILLTYCLDSKTLGTFTRTCEMDIWTLRLPSDSSKLVGEKLSNWTDKQIILYR